MRGWSGNKVYLVLPPGMIGSICMCLSTTLICPRVARSSKSPVAAFVGACLGFDTFWGRCIMHVGDDFD